jgi:hypothetical protein
MNQRAIHGFTQTSGEIYPASAAQAPMRLPQRLDFAIELSQEGWTWFSTGPLCDPEFAQATLHMSGSANIKRFVTNHL